jgi:hypothetical protein
MDYDTRPAWLVFTVALTTATIALGIPDLWVQAREGTVLMIEPVMMASVAIGLALIPAALAWMACTALGSHAPDLLPDEIERVMRPEVAVEPTSADRLRGFNVVTSGTPLPPSLRVTD